MSEHSAIQISEPQNLRKPKCNRLAELNRALNLVRAVGMNDEMASDWLASALAEFRHLPDSAFMAGVTKARRTCTHHAQIVPTILEEGEKAQSISSADRFIEQWQVGVNRYIEEVHPELRKGISDQSETQKLIAQTARGLKA